jgi:LacI family gluconate utilization system Gnt-I transcriptional repressor
LRIRPGISYYEETVKVKPKMKKKPIRMSDIALTVGVTAMTVSRALNQPDSVAKETRDKIHEVINSQGYVVNEVAGSLRSKRSRGVVCIVPHIANSVFSDTFQGLNDALRPAGMHVILGTSGYSSEEESRVLAELARLRPEAVVLWGTRRHPKSRALLRQLGVHVIEIFDYVLDPFDQVIGFSNELAMQAMANHLLRTGKSRIAFVGSTNELDVGSTRRMHGWRTALQEAGIETDGLLFEADASTVGGELILQKMNSSGLGIDAVCCANDLLGIGILSACRRMEISVPDDLAIAGFGDYPVSQSVHPPLTTVRIPRYQIGKIAGEQILNRMAGIPTTIQAIDLGFEIIERESTTVAATLI